MQTQEDQQTPSKINRKKKTKNKHHNDGIFNSLQRFHMTIEKVMKLDPYIMQYGNFRIKHKL